MDMTYNISTPSCEISGVSEDDYRAYLRGEKTIEDFLADTSRLQEELPELSKATMAKSMARATKEAIMSGMKMVPKERRENRIGICTGKCEFYSKTNARCSICGCFVNFKSTLEAWHCPIGKW